MTFYVLCVVAHVFCNTACRYEDIEATLVSLVRSNVFPGLSIEKGVSLLHAMTDEEDKDYELRCRRRKLCLSEYLLRSQ